MDTAEDATEALQHYEGNGLGVTDGERYLRLYGTLQAIILQQDAITALHEIIVGCTLVFGNAWTESRDIRVLVAGHPVESRKLGKRCGISRVTIRDSGFELVLWDINKEKYEFRTIALGSLMAAYKSEAFSHLERILSGL